MIYMVEHTIGMPEIEPEWNDWYTGYLKILLAVPGIYSAQRFIIAGSKPARYMAMYTVASGDVFESEVYKKSGGGGTASARFRPAYQSWTRNLFEHRGLAPAPALDEVLRIVDRGEPGGAPYLWLKTVGLHKTTACRGLAVMKRDVPVFAEQDSSSVDYTPLTQQFTSST